VLTPFRRNARPDTVSAPLILWPISPRRVIALTNEPREDKALIRQATGKDECHNNVRLVITAPRASQIAARERVRVSFSFRPDMCDVLSGTR
jgi:hypothetical protein